MPVFFWGALIGLLGNLFVKVGSIVIQVIRNIMPIVRQVFDVVRAALATVGRNAGRFFGWIVRSVRSVYDSVVRPLVESVRRYYDRFSAFLRRVFDPIVRFIDRVQRILAKIWSKVIAPILGFLDKLRAALRILAKLGVPYAEALEGVLARIQREIFTRFRQVQNWVNTATQWLDLLLDPRGWIKSTPFLYTVFRYSGNILNLITKLADPEGKERERIETFRLENQPHGLSVPLERFKSGATKESFAVQNAVARFKSRKTGTVS